MAGGAERAKTGSNTGGAARVVAGKFELLRPLAEGGMGTVYVARHRLTRAEVALKLMKPEASADANANERFLREVRFAAEIGHAGIVKVIDAGEDSDGSLYLAMELLKGEDLATRLERGLGSALDSLRLVLEMLDALAAAHAHGIVHRDLKPENLFITSDGRAKLLDFGIAREVGVESGTSLGMGLGTTHYMSPEQAVDARNVTPASDVWAVGVMLYEIIAGVLPFDGDNVHAVIIKAYSEAHRPLSERRPGLDPRLSKLVDDCLVKKPDARVQDAASLAARLGPLLEDPIVAAYLTRLQTAQIGAIGPTQTGPRAVLLAKTGELGAPRPTPAPTIGAFDVQFEAPERSQTPQPETAVTRAPRRAIPIAIGALVIAGTLAGLLAWGLFGSRPAASERTLPVAPQSEVRDNAVGPAEPAPTVAEGNPDEPVNPANTEQPGEPAPAENDGTPRNNESAAERTVRERARLRTERIPEAPTAAPVVAEPQGPAPQVEPPAAPVAAAAPTPVEPVVVPEPVRPLPPPPVARPATPATPPVARPPVRPPQTPAVVRPPVSF